MSEVFRTESPWQNVWRKGDVNELHVSNEKDLNKEILPIGDKADDFG